MKFFAYYLPQFHTIPENDGWWGKGFTEWTNVKKATPLFPGHKQPLFPGELGYYSLEDPDTLKLQASLAKSYGVDGFVFYHYWFGNGKTLLERPLQDFLKNTNVDIQFAMCWANESWKGTWHGAGNRMLQEQLYPGKEDYIAHFEYLLPFFKDPRCLKIDGKSVFQVYVPESIPDLEVFVKTFDDQAKLAGLSGIYWIAVKTRANWSGLNSNFNGYVNSNLSNINQYHRKSGSGIFLRYFFNNPIVRNVLKWPKTIYYHTVRACLEDFKDQYLIDFFPLAIPNWDNTPRTKKNGTVYLNATPEAFEKHLKTCVIQASKLSSDRQIVFVKSWNEWAEGNVLEPTKKHGRDYLEVIKKIKNE
ncbi:glycosyltransferase WbsX family protein [Algoriphagus halophilus]|uniref:Glycosyltransferase WbsX n=1 Tax=Algoriphagus halophilus TaxID=226505 RepID=A0A1N6ECZ0_9BACT|nr:glycoside hydrolase family 99-like domain-containing protein [Algoriphagus halophilus]SIN80894.1 Glycosyltransferase WbsX [Algoriphagus halophilus]